MRGTLGGPKTDWDRLGKDPRLKGRGRWWKTTRPSIKCETAAEKHAYSQVFGEIRPQKHLKYTTTGLPSERGRWSPKGIACHWKLLSGDGPLRKLSQVST